MGITFKTNKPTGKYRSFSSPAHYIKIDGKTVGIIDDDDYEIRLMVMKNDIYKDNNPNSNWKWIKLKAKPISLEHAKDFIKSELETIINKNNITLHSY